MALPFAADVRRIAVAVCPGGGEPVNYFTFRPEPAATASDRMVEDDLVRGMHPMVGRRLNLWRLRDFTVTRLEAPEDVLLYHCVRPRATPPTSGWSPWPRCASSPSSATPTAAVTALPHAERAVENCLEAIRRARTERGAGGRGARHEPRVGARLAGRRGRRSTS